MKWQRRDLERAVDRLWRWTGRRLRRALLVLRTAARDIAGRRTPVVPTSPCLFLRLGLPFDAHPREVERSFRRLRQRATDNATKRLLDEAYAVLSVPARRELYVLTRRGMTQHGLGSDPQPGTVPPRSPVALIRWLLRVHDFFVPPRSS